MENNGDKEMAWSRWRTLPLHRDAGGRVDGENANRSLVFASRESESSPTERSRESQKVAGADQMQTWLDCTKKHMHWKGHTDSTAHGRYGPSEGSRTTCG